MLHSRSQHDLAENIVHIVLARLPGAPPGTKGISLFLVPKYVPGEDGELNEESTKAKNVTCVGIETKMGIKSSATCVMGFENSKGWLIGEENDGLEQVRARREYIPIAPLLLPSVLTPSTTTRCSPS